MRRAVVVVVGAALVVGLTACGEKSGGASGKASEAPRVTATATVTPSATAPTVSPSVVAEPSPTPSATRPSPTVSVAPSASPSPSRPVRAQVTVTPVTKGGRLVVRGGGPAQEFAVTLRNDTRRDYARLAIGLAMEPSWEEGGPADWGLRAERWDPAAGRWRAADIVVAGDVAVLYQTVGGTALPRGAERTVRYRIKATGPRPVGSTWIGVDAVVTGLPEDAPAEARLAGHSRLPVDINAR
ncbi:hypothetical protein [Streptomyces sp. NBC_01353]|uniref:hypothetical protein n=1 Tax=Streptomyces sp. NBC_01353 TaxID=2903835 RepID=UPI002E313AB3|nr:hypothetical protein [Streptomyces sp. NBC_01353]